MYHDQKSHSSPPSYLWWGVNRTADLCCFSPSLSHQLLIILKGSTELGCATPALTLHAKSTPAAKIITDHCLSPVPQPTVTVCTQTAVYAEMCSTWQRRLTAACTMPKVGVVGGGWDHKRSSVSVSQAPAGSLYCTDWLMYSDHPESTMLDGKKELNWW